MAGQGAEAENEGEGKDIFFPHSFVSPPEPKIKGFKPVYAGHNQDKEEGLENMMYRNPGIGSMGVKGLVIKKTGNHARYPGDA